MRLAPLLALVVLASVARAQGIPDPTPPADYYPLEVGNEWIYFERTILFHGYQRRRILREEAVGSTRHSVEQFCAYDLQAASPSWTCTGERLVRFDPVTTNVLVRYGDREGVLYCDLGADFDTSVSCGGHPWDGYLDLGSSTVQIGDIDYPVARLKGIRTLADPPPPPLAAGIGPLEPYFYGTVGVSRFQYARVRGVEYGVRPVAGEAPPRAAAFALAASPNPTAGPLAITVTLAAAQAVRLEAFDALGRRVWRTEAPRGAGEQRLAVDASAWAPGVYVVRATAGSASAAARIVRR